MKQILIDQFNRVRLKPGGGTECINGDGGTSGIEGWD